MFAIVAARQQRTSAACRKRVPHQLDTLMQMQKSFDIAQGQEKEGKINVAPFEGRSAEPQPALF